MLSGHCDSVTGKKGETYLDRDVPRFALDGAFFFFAFFATKNDLKSLLLSSDLSMVWRVCLRSS